MDLELLASGSSGNSALLTGGHGRLLIDAGISMRRITAALRAGGVSPETLSAILVTHAHSDHVKGLGMLTKYYRLPIICSPGCAGELLRLIPETAAYIHTVRPGEDFTCGGFVVRGFSTPHDSPGSMGWRFTSGGKALSFVTDLGWASPEVLDGVTGSDAAVLEANYDLKLLMSGPYPYYLKTRIHSPNGHLCNEDSGALAALLVKSGAKQLILAHLSQENNTPALALQAVQAALAREGLAAKLSVARRTEKSERISV